MASGRVFDIQTCSLHDGPGIRTTVFLKGCPMRCVWCHNPEGIPPQPVISYDASRCRSCGACASACPRDAHRVEANEHSFERDLCDACGACADACPSGALRLVGRDMTVEEVMAAVRPDAPFYRASGGGLTVSGGEPMSQSEFARSLVSAARAEGIHTCVETSGLCSRTDLVALAPVVDLFLVDWKETDPERHRRCTGRDNARVRSNIVALSDAGASIMLRCPVVPGYNDRADHFAGIAEIVSSVGGVSDFEIMPYHQLAAGKYGMFGITAPEAACVTPCDEATALEWRREVERRVARPAPPRRVRAVQG